MYLTCCNYLEKEIKAEKPTSSLQVTHTQTLHTKKVPSHELSLSLMNPPDEKDKTESS